MSKNITKKDFFTVALDVFGAMDPDRSFEVSGKGAVTASEVANQFAHELDLLAKKSSGERKPTKAQIESAERRELILSALSDEGQTISDIQAAEPALASLTGHQMSALLAPMVRNGAVVKTKVKGVTYFALPSAE